MTTADLFFVVFSAVFFALLLAGVFCWGMVSYSRLERDGTQNTSRGWGPFAAIMLPLLFGALCTSVALDKVPDWLNAALQ